MVRAEEFGLMKRREQEINEMRSRELLLVRSVARGKMTVVSLVPSAGRIEYEDGSMCWVKERSKLGSAFRGLTAVFVWESK